MAQEQEIVYDGDCPICRTYCSSLTLSDGITLVDARKKSRTMEEITRRGLDIDEGMVLKADGKLFYGSEAMLEITRRLPRRGWTGWLNRIFFSGPASSRIFYAAAKAVRNLLLRLLRVPKINNLQKPET